MMGMQFSLAHLTVLGCAPPEMTYIAARAGYDFISPRIIMMGVPFENQLNYELANNKGMLRETKKALASTGVRVHDIELARIHDGVNVESYAPAMGVAAELGAHHVISSVWTPDRDYAIDRYVELCEIAKPYGLTVDLEFVTWANLTNLREAIAFLRDARRDNCGILVDILHFHRSRVSVSELDTVPREWLHFIHLCDAPASIPTTKEELIFAGREERLYVGDGGIDIASIVNRMPEVPYSIELPNIGRVKEMGYAEHARSCLESARKYFSAHPREKTADQTSKEGSGHRRHGSPLKA